MILLTGATGFFGMNAMKELLSREEEILATDLDDFPQMESKLFSSKEEEMFTFVKGDISNKDDVRSFFEDRDVDTVVHAAAVTVLEDEDEEKSRLVFNVNAKGTLNMLEAAKEFGVSRFVYVSSSGVYGSAGRGVIPVHESTPYQPMGLYVAAKIHSELMCRRFDDFSPFKTVVARIGSPYGPWERPTGTRKNMSPIFRLVHMGFTGEKAKIYGADAVRDWTHMRDVAKGVVDLATENQGNLEHLTYNVTSGDNVSIGYVAEKLSDLAPDFNYELVRTAGEANIVTELSNPRGPLDITRLKKDCSFEPKYDMDRGLSDYVNWIKKYE